jgi:hypothetical protein
MSAPDPKALHRKIMEHYEKEAVVCDRYPELSLRVWATSEGMKVSALLYGPGPRYARPLIQIADAIWRPAEVTEEAVVDWGRRALGKWLEDRLQEEKE